MTRVNLVDLEMLKLMKKAGIYLFYIGFESANQKTLDELNTNSWKTFYNNQNIENIFDKNRQLL